MKHTLQIRVSKTPKDDGVAAVRYLPMREKLLRFFLGGKTNLAVIVPGNSVEELAIREISEGGAAHEAV